MTLAIPLSILSSILLVSLNKHIFAAFPFPATLSAAHFACTLALASARAAPNTPALPLAHRVLYAALNVTSVLSLNAAIRTCPLAVYQLFKVAIGPLVCVGESIFLNRTVSPRAYLAALLVSAGSLIASPGQQAPTPAQLFTLTVLVVSTTAFNLYSGHLFKDPRLSSLGLLRQTFLPASIFMGLAIPFLDDVALLSAAPVTPHTVALILASCGLAFLVNISAATIVGTMSPLAYQIVSHAKTVLVIASGTFIFGEALPPSRLLGMALSAVGVVVYFNR